MNLAGIQIAAPLSVGLSGAPIPALFGSSNLDGFAPLLAGFISKDELSNLDAFGNLVPSTSQPVAKSEPKPDVRSNAALSLKHATKNEQPRSKPPATASWQQVPVKLPTRPVLPIPQTTNWNEPPIVALPANFTIRTESSAPLSAIQIPIRSVPTGIIQSASSPRIPGGDIAVRIIPSGQPIAEKPSTAPVAFGLQLTPTWSKTSVTMPEQSIDNVPAQPELAVNNTDDSTLPHAPAPEPTMPARNTDPKAAPGVARQLSSPTQPKENSSSPGMPTKEAPPEEFPVPVEFVQGVVPAVPPVSARVPDQQQPSEPVKPPPSVDLQTHKRTADIDQVVPPQEKSEQSEPIRATPSSPTRVIPPRASQHSSGDQQGREDAAPKDAKPQNVAIRPENPMPKTHFHFEGQSQPMQVTKDTRDSRPAAEAPQSSTRASVVEASPVSRPQPAREINLKLEGADATKVDVRLTERAGKVQVQVRTQDHELTKSLQGGLGDLVSRLENKGFKTEAWVPSATRHVQAGSFESSNAGNSNSGHSGSGSREQQQQQPRHGSNSRHRPRWTAQLDASLSTEETRTNTR